MTISKSCLWQGFRWSHTIAALTIMLLPTLSFGADLMLQNAPVSVYFSPRGGAEDAVVAEVGRATETVSVLAYSFTSPAIVTALVEAHRRGVKVTLVLDKSQRSDQRSGTEDAVRAGIPTYIDSRHAIAHNKVMVIDGHKVITGSFNFTRSAEERNAENLLIIESAELTRLYQQEWDKHARHSERRQ